MPLVNIGTVADDGTGDPLRTAFSKINAILDVSSIKIAIGIGALALYTASVSVGSIGIGRNALALAVTGADDNVAIGHLALAVVVTGGNNTAIGSQALNLNTASYNTAIGSNALPVNTSGTYNIGIGPAALYSNVTGSYNTAIGLNSLQIATTAINNIAIGTFTMREWTSGDSNVAVGTEALHGNIHGDQIVDGAFTAPATYWILGAGWSDGGGYASHGADGVGTLTPYAAYIDYGTGAAYSIQYDVVNYVSGTATLSFGGVADTPRSANGTYTFPCVPTVYPGGLSVVCSNTARLGIDNVSLVCTDSTATGSNVAIGSGAGYMTTSGYDNVYVGVGSGRQHTTGIKNVGVGVQALVQNGTGNNNTAIGFDALFSGNANSGCVAIGFGAGYYETADNKLFIDNALRANEADGRAKALVYGVFGATPASQSFVVNGAVTAGLGLTIPSGSDLTLGLNYGVVIGGSRVAAFTSFGLSLAAGGAGGAPFNIAHGVAPSAPANGDIWTTTAGLFVRVNGVTVGPLT